MPLRPDELAALDLQQRRKRLALQARAGLIVTSLFRRLTPADIAARNSPAVEEWLRASTTATSQLKAIAASAAQDYYDVVRDSQVPGTPKRTFEILDTSDVERIRSSLFVTGVVGARKRLDAVPGIVEPQQATATTLEREQANDIRDLRTYLDRQLEVLRAGNQQRISEAIDTSAQAASASAGRHVANAERDQIKQTAKADPRALGYIRTLGPDPCFFCAMLASRGPVYESDSFDDSDPRFEGPGSAKVHDNCSCGLRPVFTRGASEIPELNGLFMDMWVEGMSLLEWRQMFEGRAA